MVNTFDPPCFHWCCKNETYNVQLTSYINKLYAHVLQIFLVFCMMSIYSTFHIENMKSTTWDLLNKKCIVKYYFRLKVGQGSKEKWNRIADYCTTVVSS